MNDVCDEKHASGFSDLFSQTASDFLLSQPANTNGENDAFAYEVASESSIARDYDPSVGRWVSKDPSRFAGGLNFYAYANGDPINYIDSDGHTPVAVVWIFVAALYAAFTVDNHENSAAIVGTVEFMAGAYVPGAGAPIAAGFSEEQMVCKANLSTSERRAIRSLQSQRERHLSKLDAYMDNPEAFDNKGFLRSAPNRDAVIEGRSAHLRGEIQNFDTQIDQILSGR